MRTRTPGWYGLASVLALGVALAFTISVVAANPSSGGAAAPEPARVRLALLANDGQPEPPPLPAPRRRAGPLRIWSDGDSTSYFMTVALFDLMRHRGAEPVRAADYKISSGLANRGTSAILGEPFGDWFSYGSEEMARYAPDVVVFMVGANDLGYAAANPADYAARVAAMMDVLLAPGRIVLWIGQPNLTRADLVPLVPGINAIFRDQAAIHPGVVFVDTSSITPDANDGVHFSPGGGYALAALAVFALDAR